MDPRAGLEVLKNEKSLTLAGKRTGCLCFPASVLGTLPTELYRLHFEHMMMHWIGCIRNGK